MNDTKGPKDMERMEKGKEIDLVDLVSNSIKVMVKVKRKAYTIEYLQGNRTDEVTYTTQTVKIYGTFSSSERRRGTF